MTALPTPLCERTWDAAMVGPFLDWAGYAVPARFDTPEAEMMALRHGAGLTDVSPLRKIHVGGTGAPAMLDRALTAQIAELAPHALALALACDSRGRLVARLEIARLTGTDFLICSDADIGPWLEDACLDDTVTITDLSAGYAAMALYGPRARAVLTAAGFTGTATQLPGTVSFVKLGAHLVQVVMPGSLCAAYGLPHAVQLWVPLSAATEVWDRVLSAAPEICRPIGRETLDARRVLIGQARQGPDFDGIMTALDPKGVPTPFDLGWGPLIDFAKPAFSGRSALAGLMTHRRGARLARLDLTDEAVVGGPVRYRGRAMGRLTSAARCPLGGERRGLALCAQPAPQDAEWTVCRAGPGRGDGAAARCVAPPAEPDDQSPVPAARTAPFVPLKGKADPRAAAQALRPKPARDAMAAANTDTRTVRDDTDPPLFSDGLVPLMRKSS